MELTRTLTTSGLLLGVDGRIDGYWSDHLDVALDEAVREGHHRITLDCEKVNFISSAGIGVLMKHHKELSHIGGAFVLVNASQPVRTVLQISRLSELLLSGVPAEAAVPVVAASRTVDADGLHLELFELDAHATLACRPFGSADPLTQGRFSAEQCVALASVGPRFAVGVGAFGDSYDECRGRFGELVAVQGATAYQPADGTNVPDYLLTQGGPAADVRMLYGLGAHGAFAHLVRFEPVSRGATVSLSHLLGACLDATGASALGVVGQAPIAEVWHRNDDDSARAQQAVCLGQRRARLVRVLEHVLHQHQVEALGGKVDTLERRHLSIEPLRPTLVHGRLAHIDTARLQPKLTTSLHRVAIAAADVEHTLHARERHGSANLPLGLIHAMAKALIALAFVGAGLLGLIPIDVSMPRQRVTLEHQTAMLAGRED